jgi:isopenicillin N synthase-like dioxygenase
VNNADLCRRWTNDRFRSAPHRVINKTGQQRHSIPFFTAPRGDVVLECLPTCRGPDNPPRYAPISYGEWIAEINRTNYDFLRANERAAG